MAPLATRRIVMFRRLFKHRWCYAIVFTLAFVFFVATRDSWEPSLRGVHGERDRVRAERFDKRKLAEEQEQIDEPVVNEGGIDLRPDLKTVFKKGERSAYETGDPGVNTGPGGANSCQLTLSPCRRRRQAGPSRPQRRARFTRLRRVRLQHVRQRSDLVEPHDPRHATQGVGG